MRKYLSLAIISLLCLTVTACAVNAVRHGQISENQYQSNTQTFSLTIPPGATISDGTHALGGYAVIQGLPKPLKIQGISYNRTANITSETSEAARKDMIKSSHNFWAKTYSGSNLKVIHNEWISLNGEPAYFTILEAPAEGLLVRPNNFYGTLSFLNGKYTYVLFDRVRTGKQLIGTTGLPEEAEAVARKQALLSFYKQVRFK